MKYIKQFMIIMIIAFMGECIKELLPFKIPASVYGLAIMLIGLMSGVIKLDAVKDTAEFFIDYADSVGELHRKQINANEAKKLIDYDVVSTLNYNEDEIPTSSAVSDAIEAMKVLLEQSDAATLESANAYADDLNSLINVRVSTLETWHKNFIEVSEEEINALFT